LQLEIAQHPIIGNEQKSKDFWQRVQQSFQTALPTANRPADSLSNRWRTIQQTVNKFAGCFATIEDRNESGKTLEDKVADAKALYFEDRGKAFTMDPLWRKLRDAPKWQEFVGRLAGKRKHQLAIQDEEGEEGLPSLSSPEEERPRGRESAKRETAGNVSIAASIERLANEAERKSKALEAATEDRIMSLNTENMSEMQKQWYQLKQAEILRKLQNSQE